MPVERSGWATSRAESPSGPVGVQPYDVAFRAGATWVTDFADSRVSRIDADTNRLTAVRTGGNPAGIAPLAGALWLQLADRGR